MKNATEVCGRVVLASSSKIEERVRLNLPSASESLRQPAQLVGTAHREAGIDATVTARALSLSRYTTTHSVLRLRVTV